MVLFYLLQVLFLALFTSSLYSYKGNNGRLVKRTKSSIFSHVRKEAAPWQKANAYISDQVYISDQGHFSLRYGSDLVQSPKPLKTHKYETLFKSENFKGLSIGITVDPVKINRITDFSDPESLGKRVLAVEQSKEGYISGSVLNVDTSTLLVPSSGDDGIPVYDIEYVAESTRGKMHYKVRTTVFNQLLYVLTAQCKEESYDLVREEVDEVLRTFQIVYPSEDM